MAISYYVSKGYIVCYPLTDNARYDLVVEKSGMLLRVQCKSTQYIEKGSYRVQLKTCGGNQSGAGKSKKLSMDECDLLFVYAFNGEMYEFPPDIFDGKGSLTLGVHQQNYKVNIGP